MTPERLHVVWIGPRPFPHDDYLGEWRKLHPGWQVDLWDEARLAGERLAVEPMVEQVPHFAGKSNLIRLELLARYGGVYVDADCQPLRPLSTLPVPDGADSWGMTSRHDFVQNAVLAATPQHPVFTRLVEQVEDAFEGLRGRTVQFTEVFGSHYITGPLRAHPHFWEPDRGRPYRKRQVFRDREEGDPGEAWIVHDCDRSWKQELGGSKVRL